MTISFRVLVLLALVSSSSGCAANAIISSSEGADLITATEIRESSNVASAYELVDRHRPQWLRARGSTSLRDPSPTVPQVYVDDVYYGTLSSLHSIRPEWIGEMQYLSATDATTRYGTGHSGGVISVVLIRMH